MQFNELLTKFNWVDVFVFTPILLRALYIGVRQGFIIEFFKTAGVFAVSYLSLHYYLVVGGVLSGKTPFASDAINAAAYFTIICAVFLSFFFIRRGFLSIFKIETITLFNAWGGAALGFIRGILTTSIVMVFLLILNNAYLAGSVKESFFGGRLVRASPAVYRFIFDNFTAKFSPDEQINQNVFQILEAE